MWRPCSASDEHRVVALCLALFTEDPGIVPVDEAKVRRTLATFRAGEGRGVCAVLDDGEVNGYAFLVPLWSNELGGELCVVDELYVAPVSRGRGAARALLESVVRGDGPWPGTPVALQLEVSPSNRRARALYDRLGFGALRNDVLRLPAWAAGT